MSMSLVKLRTCLAFFGHEHVGLLCLRVIPVHPNNVTGKDPQHEGRIIHGTLTEFDTLFLLLLDPVVDSSPLIIMNKLLNGFNTFRSLSLLKFFLLPSSDVCPLLKSACISKRYDTTSY